MPIDRSSPTPPYYEYLTKYLLSTGEQAPAGAIFAKAIPVYVPSFQRGISWTDETVEKFLDSESVLLGTVILGKVGNEPAQLIDGLQRFAIGTALLALLYPRVLSPTPSMPSVSSHFELLKTYTSSFEPIFAENHKKLSAFPRDAIRKQYLEIVADLDSNIAKELTNEHSAVEIFAKKCTSLFVDKQIAIDLYHGFSTSSQLVNAFIGLNTVRVDLTVVDLLRAALIDQATALKWESSDVEAIENEFTETFTKDAKPNRNLLPLATLIAYDLKNQRLAFSNWSGLAPHHVRRLLEFVDEALEAASKSSTGYLFEIRNCGALPFSICVLYYYLAAARTASEKDEALVNPLLEQKPETVVELHTYYRACARRMLNGDIGKIGPAGYLIIDADLNTVSMLDVAAAINPHSAGALNEAPSKAWLTGRLRTCSKERAKTVFNAYLLPLREEVGGQYAPYQYGQRNSQYQIDHIIPQITKTLDGSNVNRELLVNFCPLIGQDNNRARHQDASAKVGPNGLYAMTSRSHHPYMKWLSKSQGGLAGSLDDVTLLAEGREPAIGDERIAHLETTLRARL